MSWTGAVRAFTRRSTDSNESQGGALNTSWSPTLAALGLRRTNRSDKYRQFTDYRQYA